MLVPMKEMVAAARRGAYAVPAFNYYNQDSADAIVEEAEAKGSPVVLMISGVYLDAMGMDLAVALGKQSARKVKTPVALHLDHGASYELAEACVKAGFSSVMIDGSHHPYEDNIKLTRKVVDMAHQQGVTVEAELGAVGGIEDAVFDEAAPTKLVLIDPAQAADFVNRTNIDCLAPAIGTVHGITRQEPRLDISLLCQVHEQVAVPLVLHGGSGISDETIRELIRKGISKVNVGSELKVAWRDGLSAFFAEGRYEPRMGVLCAKESIRKVIGKKIELLGAVGRA